MQQTITGTNADHVLWCHMVWLGHNELTRYPRWHHMATKIWVIIGSGHGLLPEPKSVLTEVPN